MPKVGKQDVWVLSEPLSKSSINCWGVTISKAFRSQLVIPEPDSLADHRKKSSRWIVQIFVEVTEFGTPEVLELRIKGSTNSIKNEPDRFIERFDMDAMAVHLEQLKFFEVNRVKIIQWAVLALADDWKQLPEKSQWGKSRVFPKLDQATRKNLSRAIDKRLHQKITPEFLKEVAKVHSEAIENGFPANREIGSVFNTSIKSAERWVAMARELGLIAKPVQAKKTTKKNKGR